LFKLNFKYFKLFFRKHISLARILRKSPQKEITVDKVRITTPRKPNSARRKTVRAFYKKDKKIVLSYIPGGKNTLKKFSAVLIRGGGARDLPGIYSSGIRGSRDLYGILNRSRRRSIYGTKKK
jgi:small subunit ribosomal protein S12